MVTDIVARAEQRVAGQWQVILNLRPFDGWATYRLFGFLADVRNYAAIEPISQPRGLPDEIELSVDNEDCDPSSELYLGEHDHSWLFLAELMSADYDRIVEDRRTSGVVDGLRYGNLTAQRGKGVKMTLREFLGSEYFEELDRLMQAGAQRIAFGFES